MATGKSGGKIDENPAVIMVSFFLMGKVLLNPSTCKMNGLSPFQFKLPSAFVFLCRTKQEGRPGFDAKLFLKIYFYGYLNGIIS